MTGDLIDRPSDWTRWGLPGTP